MAIAISGACAVFLDKDGTLIEDIPYNVDPELMRPLDGVVEALRGWHEAGYQLIVVTNQSGVARGFFPERALLKVEQQLRLIFESAGAHLTDFYYCPHHPQAALAEYAVQCACRKPLPGMLLQAARDHQLDLSRSWMVGDILHDVQAGNSAGCRTVLIDNGNETEWDAAPGRKPDFTVKSISEAAQVITRSVAAPDWTYQHGNQKQRSA